MYFGLSALLGNKILTVCLDEFEFRFNNEENSFLFRDTLLRLLNLSIWNALLTTMGVVKLWSASLPHREPVKIRWKTAYTNKPNLSAIIMMVSLVAPPTIDSGTGPRKP